MFFQMSALHTTFLTVSITVTIGTQYWIKFKPQAQFSYEKGKRVSKKKLG